MRSFVLIYNQMLNICSFPLHVLQLLMNVCMFRNFLLKYFTMSKAYQVQYLNVLSVIILENISPRGSAKIISNADASHEAADERSIM